MVFAEIYLSNDCFLEFDGTDLIEIIFDGRLLIPQLATGYGSPSAESCVGLFGLAAALNPSRQQSSSSLQATVASKLICSLFTFPFPFLYSFVIHFIKSVFQWEPGARHFYWLLCKCIYFY